MKRIILSCAFTGIFLISFGQFHYTFTSVPDSALVKKNGAEECYTPCRVKYQWRDAIAGKITFDVETPGYETWSDTIYKKPSDFDKTQRIGLKRSLPVFELDSAKVIVGFDRLLADFKDGTAVGSKTYLNGKTDVLKWEGSVKLGEQAFEDRFYEILTNAGFPTPVSQGAELFSNSNQRRPSLPRFVVGIKLVEYNINLKESEEEDYGAGEMIGRNSMLLEWQVLDKTTGEVVLTQRTGGVARYRQNRYFNSIDNMTAYEGALIEFLNDGQFYNLVRNADSGNFGSVVNTSAGSEITVIRPALPDFNSVSEMIKHANRSCVTILTDGGHGSGAIINSEGYVLSAYHVVEGINRVQVQFSDGLMLDASIVAFDKARDIVLLDIAGSGFQALPLAADQEFMLGEDVITIGTPAELELGQSIAKGILSGKRLVDNTVYLQMDIDVSPGNSGGPLLNLKGEIIGVVQRKIIDTGVEGIGFALPVDAAIEVLNITVGI